MGGFGSGDWSDPSTRKTSVEQCMILSVRSLRLSGFLAAGRAGEIKWSNGAGEIIGKASIEMLNRDGELRLKISDYYVDMIRTECNYGGVRSWFLCPVSVDGVYCGNRCSKLYLPPAGKYFGCRHCYDLTYRSCQESHKYDNVFGYIDNIDIDKLSVAQVLRLGELLK